MTNTITKKAGKIKDYYNEVKEINNKKPGQISTALLNRKPARVSKSLAIYLQNNLTNR